MQKCLIKLVIVISFLFVFNQTIYAETYKQYRLDDYVFFDPVSTNKCNYTNYWTYYNQDTTCYRFIILDSNDTTSKSTIKIMLDHDVGYDTYDNYQSVLTNKTSNWTRYTGTIDIIDENTIYTMMKLSSKPTLENISINGGVAYSFLSTNTMYVYNKTVHNTYGIWSKTLYESNNNWVYTITEYGNNRLVERTSKRGIRPVITINKSLLTNNYSRTNISSKISLAYSFKNNNDVYEGMTFSNMQGFTITNDKLVFYSTNSQKNENGVIYWNSGTNYGTVAKKEYGETGHGNDMTYNSKTNQVILVGPNGYKDIYVYDNSTMTHTKTYQANPTYSAIGYDSVNDKYIALGPNRIYVLSNQFEPLYSFDANRFHITQGLEYHNGYVYFTLFTNSCPSSYQTHCFDPDFSAQIYVYNAKLNKDGTPSKDFGKMVKEIYIDPGIGELESISFHDNKAYFGYATWHYDNVNSRKIYGINYSEIAEVLPYDNIVNIYNNKTTSTMIMNEEIKSVSGWNQTSNSKKMYKSITSGTFSNISLCDLYTNCKTVNPNKASIKINNVDIDNNKNILCRISPNLTFTNFKNQITMSSGSLSLLNNNNGSENNNSLIKTGYKLKMIIDTRKYEYLLSVSGDVDSNGLANKTDANKIAKHIINKNIITGDVYLKAADYNGDNTIKMNDVMKLLHG